jgi:hypothetical protein
MKLKAMMWRPFDVLALQTRTHRATASHFFLPRLRLRDGAGPASPARLRGETCNCRMRKSVLHPQARSLGIAFALEARQLGKLNFGEGKTLATRFGL